MRACVCAFASVRARVWAFVMCEKMPDSDDIKLNVHSLRFLCRRCCSSVVTLRWPSRLRQRKTRISLLWELTSRVIRQTLSVQAENDTPSHLLKLTCVSLAPNRNSRLCQDAEAKQTIHQSSGSCWSRRPSTYHERIHVIAREATMWIKGPRRKTLQLGRGYAGVSLCSSKLDSRCGGKALRCTPGGQNVMSTSGVPMVEIPSK